jgi:zinc/manganese transport system ATP-binding protein
VNYSLAVQHETTQVNAARPLITASKLVAGYGQELIWKDADFEIDKGEFVAIIGPNGAGKTTLFRLLLGLQNPVRGSVSVFGSVPRRGNSRIGYVPQKHLIDSESHVETIELVRLGVSGTKWGFGLSHGDRKAALEALDSVGATELAHRHLGELSGGELQRIFLAEALVSNPEVLLLDEPLSNLDIRRERELVRLIHDIVSTRGVTALLIAHNINPLLPYLDRVIYMANGKVASGRPQDVLTSESLSALYGVQVEVLHDSRGNVAIVGIEGNDGDEK